MKQLVALLIMVGICLSILSACNSQEKVNIAKDDEELVATVNGVGISKAEYQKVLDGMKSMYAQQGIEIETLGKEMVEQIETQALDQLINTELLTQLATNESIEVEDEILNKQLEVIKGQFENKEKYLEALEKNELSEEDLKEKVKADIQITEFLDKRIGNVVVTDAEIMKAYDDYKEAMLAQEQEVEEFEDFKVQIEQQILAKKKQEKAANIIKKLRLDNDIKML